MMFRTIFLLTLATLAIPLMDLMGLTLALSLMAFTKTGVLNDFGQPLSGLLLTWPMARNMALVLQKVVLVAFKVMETSI